MFRAHILIISTSQHKYDNKCVNKSDHTVNSVKKLWDAFNSLLSNLFSNCGQRWNDLILLSSMMISWNENVLCTRTFMCPWLLLEQSVGQTLEWLVSWDFMSTACDSYISVGLPACDTVLKYFPGFSPEFNRYIRRSRYIDLYDY